MVQRILQYFAKNYRNLLELKETTARRLKDLYKSNLLQYPPPKKSDTDDSDEDQDTKKSPTKLKNCLIRKLVSH